MSTNRGIFESFPNQSASRQDSPFSAFNEPSTESANPQASPFTAVGKQDSPFTVVDELADGKAGDAGKGSKIPERRKLDSPFQIAEPSEGFGFEAVPPPASSNPFEPAPASSASPFTVAEPKRPAISPTQAAIAAFTTWQDPNAPAHPAGSLGTSRSENRRHKRFCGSRSRAGSVRICRSARSGAGGEGAKSDSCRSHFHSSHPPSRDRDPDRDPYHDPSSSIPIR